MFFSLQTAIGWLTHYGYLMLFPIVVVEGPIITVVAGFFLSLGYFNGPLAFLIIVLADLTGDVLHYGVGRISRYGFGKKITGFLGMTESRLEKVENHFKTHPKKTLVFGKISHGIGGAVLVAAGIAKMRFGEFIFYNAIATVPKSLILFLIGYFFGQSILSIKKYFDYGTIFTLIAAIILIITYILVKRYAEKSESALSNGK